MQAFSQITEAGAFQLTCLHGASHEALMTDEFKSVKLFFYLSRAFLVWF